MRIIIEKLRDNKYAKPFLIIIFVLLYWTFVYYPYHYTNFTPIFFFFCGTILFFIGAYALLLKKEFKHLEIWPIYLSLLTIDLISGFLIYFAYKRQGLVPETDITIAFINNYLGFYGVFAITALAIPSYFFIIAGTRKLLGKEHIYLWYMIFLAWFISGIKLLFRIF